MIPSLFICSLVLLWFFGFFAGRSFEKRKVIIWVEDFLEENKDKEVAGEEVKT